MFKHLVLLTLLFVLTSCGNDIITLDTHVNYKTYLDTNPIYPPGTGGSEWRNGWGGHLDVDRSKIKIVIDESHQTITIHSSENLTFRIIEAQEKSINENDMLYYLWRCTDSKGDECLVSLNTFNDKSNPWLNVHYFYPEEFRHEYFGETLN